MDQKKNSQIFHEVFQKKETLAEEKTTLTTTIFEQNYDRQLLSIDSRVILSRN